MPRSPFAAVLFPSFVTALLAATATAQWTATYDTLGNGCPGTGVGLGARTTLPAAAANSWGSGNAIPFGWGACKYQQIFAGSELPNALVIGGLSLRQPHTGATAVGFTVDMEIRVGTTTKGNGTMSTTFAANWDLGAPTTVLPRTLVDFPDQAGIVPTAPSQFALTIPWTNAFAWTPQAGTNLLVEITVFGNSWGGIYGYPLDNTAGTVSAFGTPETATTANGGPVRGFGVVMGLDASTNTATPQLYTDTTPQIGDSFRVRVRQAKASTLAAMVLGWSNTSSGGNPLPVDLGVLGAPGCQILVDPLVITPLTTTATGTTNLQYQLPNDIYALGHSFYNQAWILDAAANPLGLVATNAGHGVFGNQ